MKVREWYNGTWTEDKRPYLCLCRPNLLHPLRHRSSRPPASEAPTTSSQLATQPFTSSHASVAWKKPPDDPPEQLELNVDHRYCYHIYISRKVCVGYYTWSQVPPEIRDFWWEEFQKKCIWDPALPMSKVRDAWDGGTSIQIRNLMGDIQKDGKWPSWIEERYWQTILDYWKSLRFLALSQQNKKNRNEGREDETRKIHRQERFHEARRKAEEETAVAGTIVPDNLALMATVAGGERRGRMYEVGSEAVHLRAERISSYRAVLC
ncbi:hypothetical protein M9H77_14878 [Catharanthus roseus]|uniref:Uncharacterized protein n=1 Tax=Catharanthus roseus TaxID=4058 RepID=A0ACC0BPK4_CATRO|nr:hypothetical protein M9H77_14878 [Catharanthus roseus]